VGLACGAALRHVFMGRGAAATGWARPFGVAMPGYEVVQQQVNVHGVNDLCIQRLKDKQQFHDPDGLAAAQGISSAAWPLFGLVWPSGVHLAETLARRPVTQGEHILEVGCGLALASLVSHRRGAKVTASDCHPLTRHFLDQNLRLNQLGPMDYGLGHWAQRDVDLAPGNGSPGTSDRVHGRFELIMGSDVLYERDEKGVLAGFIAQHAAFASEVLIVDPNRGNRVPFHRHMALLGYEMNATVLLTPMAEGAPPYRGQLFHYQRTQSAGERCSDSQASRLLAGIGLAR
jgi:predicted nicotinamide N-methyase